MCPYIIFCSFPDALGASLHYSVTSAETGMTFTYERSSLFFVNSTMPSVKANKV